MTDDEIADIQERNIMAAKYGLFRYLIAKHFLSKTCDELDSLSKKRSFDVVALTRLFVFASVLEEMFPPGSRADNFGRKWRGKFGKIDVNTYNRMRDKELCFMRGFEPTCYKAM